MSKQFHSFLLIGVSVVSLAACSGDKGPGAIGSKDDIVVVNKNIPGAPAQAMKAEGEDFTSTVEQAEAAPAPEVAVAEDLTPAPDAANVESAQTAQADAMEQTATATEPVVETQAEMATPEAAPSAQPATSQSTPAQPAVQTAPESAEPVATPAPVQASLAQTAVPSAPVAAGQPVQAKPAPVAPTAEELKNIPYPLDPNAPYSPKAMAAAAAAAGTPVVAPEISPSGVNLNDPAIIRAVQAKMAEQKLFVGPQTGMMSADLMNAVAQYQVRNNLAVGPLNEETLKHLGIIKQ